MKIMRWPITSTPVSYTHLDVYKRQAIAGITRDDTGRGTVRLKQRPETLTVSQPFMTLFKHM